jgi:hypothetical protein
LKSLLRTLPFISAIALLVSCAQASVIFTTTLTGANESPPTGSPATGTALVTLENDNKTLDVMVTFSGLVGGPASAAHIHCCIAAGGNTSVVVPFTGFPNTTSGTYTHTFDLSDQTQLTGITLANFLTGFIADQAYVNIHNATFPNGEVRGFLVPEPWTIGLLGVAFIFLAWGRRRLRRP